MPERVQLRRVKGYRMPPNTVKVARPTIWGNPFTVAKAIEAGWCPDGAHGMAVYAFKQWLAGDADWQDSEERRAEILQRMPELRGKNLACFCPLDKPCHADVLLDLANREDQS